MLELEVVEVALKLPHLACVRLHQRAQLDFLGVADRELGIAADGEARDPQPRGNP
jgi:hypothetical protein